MSATTSTDDLWFAREQLLQSLYISPCVHAAVPGLVLGDEELPDSLTAFIQEQDLPRLSRLLDPFFRGAATRFFNLPSARRAIELALMAEADAIGEWLADETSNRFAFDSFGGPTDPIVGYGIRKQAPTSLEWTKTLRLVLQRTSDANYVLWSAYPLLASADCWIDKYDYAANAPATPIAPVFYYFLNAYLSVTSHFLGVDAVIQGASDYFQFESRALFGELLEAIAGLRSDRLAPEDEHHLRYEISTRCLDETLPDFYVATPAVFVAALQRSCRELARQYGT